MILFLYSCTYNFCDYSIFAISSDAVVSVGTDNGLAHFLFLVPILIEYFILSFDKGNAMLLDLQPLFLLVY